MGRATPDIQAVAAYFIEGMASSFERVRDQALLEAGKGGRDQSRLRRDLDAKQRRALMLFRKSREITAKQIAELFGYRPRTAALLCQRWVAQGFLAITDPAKKSRRYKLGDAYGVAFRGFSPP